MANILKQNPITDNMSAKKLTAELETIFSFYAPLAGLWGVLKKGDLKLIPASLKLSIHHISYSSVAHFLPWRGE